MSDNKNNEEDLREDDSKSSEMLSKRRIYMRKKICRFCADKGIKLDYKEVDVIRRFVTEGGKIIPRRITGNCSKHQRLLAREVKLARAIALLPYAKK